MPQAPSLWHAGAALLLCGVVTGCAAAGVTFQAKRDAPALVARPAGCNVQVVDDGTKVGRRFIDIGTVTLAMSRDGLRTEGEAGALAALRNEACARGAHILRRVRGLPMDAGGFTYEATVAVLVDDAGHAVTALPSDAGPEGHNGGQHGAPNDGPPEAQRDASASGQPATGP